MSHITHTLYFCFTSLFKAFLFFFITHVEYIFNIFDHFTHIFWNISCSFSLILSNFTSTDTHLLFLEGPSPIKIETSQNQRTYQIILCPLSLQNLFTLYSFWSIECHTWIINRLYLERLQFLLFIIKSFSKINSMWGI